MSVALRELFMQFDISFNVKELKKGAEATDKVEKKLDKLEKTEHKLDRTTARTSGTLSHLAGALAGLYAGSQIFSGLRGVAEHVRELATFGNIVSLNAAEMAAWQSIIAPTGASIDDLTSAMKDLQVRAVDAATTGIASYVDAFRSVGISVQDLRPIMHDGEAVFDLFSTRLAQTANAGQRLFAVDELMSDAGTRMLPVLMQGGAALRAQRLELRKHTGAIGEMQAGLGDWQRKSAAVQLAVNNLGARIAVKLMPYVEALATRGQAVITWFEKVIKNSYLLETALGVGAVAMGAFVLTQPWLLMAAAVVAVIAVVDDLVVAMHGGDSVAKDLLASMIGLSAAESVFEGLRLAFAGIPLEFDRAIAKGRWMLDNVFEPISRFLATINSYTVPGWILNNYRRNDLMERDRAEIHRMRQARNLSARRDPTPATASATSAPAAATVTTAAPASARAPAAGGGMNYAPQTNITVQGGGDPRQAAEEVRRVVREERSRELRRVQTVVTHGRTS